MFYSSYLFYWFNKLNSCKQRARGVTALEWNLLMAKNTMKNLRPFARLLHFARPSVSTSSRLPCTSYLGLPSFWVPSTLLLLFSPPTPG
mmetsp:Transcript_12744/g.21010  ORF Transcript_12744/g.21010 Transcript_12744/m.21010 type:complete len:89 (-) Transcript_12744:167-433(-)